MSNDTTLTEPMLWDEIMKALVYTMPDHFQDSSEHTDQAATIAALKKQLALQK